MTADSSQLPVVLIGHRDHLGPVRRGFYDALTEAFDLRVYFVEDGWPTNIAKLREAEGADACIWFVRYRLLQQAPAVDWTGFAGRRVMYDLDTNANYHDLGRRSYYGTWPGEFRRHGFDTLLSTGKRVSELLREDGVNAVWFPKAYDLQRLFDLGRPRSGICTFGQPYPSRRAMLSHVKRRRIPVERFSSRTELNEYLNKYQACLICNLGGSVRGGKVGQWVNRAFPARLVDLQPGIEPMLKNFEVAGAGCVPIADHIPEMEDLGFIDGRNYVAWQDFDELVDRCRFYLDRPELLDQMGTAALELAQERHTWRQRADQLDQILREHTSRE